MSGSLYIVATPIGNLSDITLRAIETLKNVDLVLAEDTRHSKKLFDHYEIKSPLTAFHEHNENENGACILILFCCIPVARDDHSSVLLCSYDKS